MSTADLIYQNAKELPEHLAQEVLDFSEYLKMKWQKTNSLINIPPKNKRPSHADLRARLPYQVIPSETLVRKERVI